MSLLIDALRKAEEAKHRAAPETHLEGPPAPPRPPETGTADRAASARNLFEVKAAARPVSFPLAVGVLTTLASLAIGVYFWLQLNPPGPRLSALPGPPPASSPPPLPAPARSPDGGAGDGAEARRPEGVRAAPGEPSRPSASEARPALADRGGSSRPRTIAAPSRGSFGSEQMPAPARRPETRPAERPPLIHKGARQAVPDTLSSAWQHYQAGRLEQAAQLYRRSLEDDPRNVDALDGLATIAARSGRPNEARRWFERSLTARPDDPIALAGLSALAAAGRPSDSAPSASRLRAAIAERPRQAALHFALGNALAAERRWAEAQKSYFEAYDLDRSNPDYLFNLGVSLDQLGQRSLARRFYAEALGAAQTRPHAFDPAGVRARLAVLPPGPAEEGKRSP